jgi:ABC-type transport system substrate-binding protein
MKRLIMFGVVAALVAAACGSADEDATAAAATTTSAAVTTTTTASPTTTTTTAPATTTTGGLPATTEAPQIPTVPVVPGEDEDVDAIVDAYSVVFDSATSYEEKVPYLVEPDGLEETVAEYSETGKAFGGVTLEAKEVGIEGDDALVIYDFLFGGNPAYPGQEGDAVRTDAGWQITREMFCSVMASARVGCP